GFAGAIGGLGGVGINLVLRASYGGTAKSATMAFWVFLAFYIACIFVTWFVFLRRPSVTRGLTVSDGDDEKVSVSA
ncbi:nitrite extrusion protein, partial [Rhodococcus wratislaviensis IFP 2016]